MKLGHISNHPQENIRLNTIFIICLLIFVSKFKGRFKINGVIR